MLMKVAVTGVSGYLGQLLARRLDADLDVESILGLDIIPSNFRSQKIHFQYADVRTADFTKLLSGIDALFYLAFIVEPPKKLSMADIEDINVEGSKHLFNSAIAIGVPKIIYSSSVAAYGAHEDNPEKLTEDSPLRPNENWYYSRTKGKVENYLNELERQHPETTIIRFRPCVFIGSTVNNSIGKSIGKQLSSRPLVCFNRDLKLDLCWDEDIVEALRLALYYDKSDIFNLTGGNPITVDDMGRLRGKKVIHPNYKLSLFFARLACKLGLLSKGTFEWLDIGVRHNINVSADKAIKKLGWKPSFDSSGAYIEFARRTELNR